VLGYLGTYYPQTQSLGPVLTAIARLRAEHVTELPRIKIIGRLNSALNEQAQTAGVGDLLQFTGVLPHPQATTEMLSCSALLVAGPVDARGLLCGHIVAKLYEYLATDLPIIYIGDPRADAARLLAGFPATHIVPTGDEATMQRLLSTPLVPATRNTDALYAGSQTQLLADLLDSLTRAHPTDAC
jgi:hypothetical protein